MRVGHPLHTKKARRWTCVIMPMMVCGKQAPWKLVNALNSKPSVKREYSNLVTIRYDCTSQNPQVRRSWRTIGFVQTPLVCTYRLRQHRRISTVVSRRSRISWRWSTSYPWWHSASRGPLGCLNELEAAKTTTFKLS